MNDIDEIVKMLDHMAAGEVSRMKVEISEKVKPGEVKRAYHHGRCDVGSPFATGKLYDLEEKEKIRDSLAAEADMQDILNGPGIG